MLSMYHFFYFYQYYLRRHSAWDEMHIQPGSIRMQDFDNAKWKYEIFENN